MLQQGKAVIDEFKGEAESVVGQINEAKESAIGLWETITGLWDWAQGLLGSVTKLDGGSKPIEAPKPVEITAPKPVEKKANRRTPERELSYEEYKTKAIHDVCAQLKIFFEAQRQLKQHCRELEEQSLTTDRVADSAIDRIEIETQLIDLSRQIREAMQWTPESLGLQDMYQRFLKMYDLILEEQEFERQRKLKKARIEEAKKWQLKNNRIDRMLSVLGVLFGVMWIWSFLLGLIWQQRTLTDFWLD